MLTLTILPLLIPVRKAESRTVKAPSHTKNMMFWVVLFSFSSDATFWLKEELIQSSQWISFIEQTLQEHLCVCHKALTAGTLLHSGDCGALLLCWGQALLLWQLSGMEVLRLKCPCCTMSWPALPCQDGIYYSTSSLSISHRTWLLVANMHIHMEPKPQSTSALLTSRTTQQGNSYYQV